MTSSTLTPDEALASAKKRTSEVQERLATLTGRFEETREQIEARAAAGQDTAAAAKRLSEIGRERTALTAELKELEQVTRLAYSDSREGNRQAQIQRAQESYATLVRQVAESEGAILTAIEDLSARVAARSAILERALAQRAELMRVTGSHVENIGRERIGNILADARKRLTDRYRYVGTWAVPVAEEFQPGRSA